MSVAARLASYAASLPTLARGFRMASLVSAAAAIARGETGVVTLRDGRTFRVRTLLDVWVVKETCLDGTYDAFSAALPDDAVVVDVGAGIGDFAVHAARARPGGRVVAIEPHPGSYRLLVENLAANRITNVEALACAVTGDARATVTLDVSASEPVLYATASGGAGLEVPNRTLASLLAERALSRVDLLKLDCEGAEFGILLGADEALLSGVRHVVLEWHDGVTPYGVADLEARLHALGFDVAARRSAVVPSTGILEARRPG